MSQDMRVALITSLQDRLVAPLRRSLDEIEKDFKDLERTVQGVTQASRQADQQMAGMRGPQEAAKQAEKLGRDTERATHLAGRLQAAWSAAGNTIRAATAAAGAVAAARAVAAPALEGARSYEYSLAMAASTAFAGQSKDQMRAGMGVLDMAVRAAVLAGGGKREDALSGLNEMISSGTVNAKTAAALLPSIQTTATASGATSKEVAAIVTRALQNGFREADIPLLLDQALAAGQAGGFELKDMAKWLPQITAMARNSGMQGPRDMPMLLAAAQTSLITAGTRDEAGNNLVNLLGKINSRDTAKDVERFGVELSGSLAAARGKGVDPLTAFVNMVDQFAAKDERLVKLRQQAAAAGTDEEKRATLNAQADILRGSAVGQVVQDRQALMALIAILNNPQYLKT
ncbi:MAG: phage tail tape measure protein, partial [Rubrivivax sp.]